MTHSVYTISEGEQILYIGCSQNVERRLAQHRWLRARPAAHVEVIGPMSRTDAYALEASLIRTARPKFNRIRERRPGVEVAVVLTAEEHKYVQEAAQAAHRSVPGQIRFFIAQSRERERSTA